MGRGRVNWTELASGPPLDAVVIGGGVNGSAIALRLASAGQRVGLFEQDDFGSGTTWRSTKLIHGGLRYLEHFELGLVFESLRERAWLLKTRPHLVHSQRFVLPILPWTRRPRWQLRAGLTAYDLMARDRRVPSHSAISAGALARAIPGISPEQDGGFTYYDAIAVAPERIALEDAMAAKQAGAFVANHAEVTHIGVSGGTVRRVTILHGGKAHDITTATVINAAGPWVDAVNTLVPDRQPRLLGITKGTHVMLRLDGDEPLAAITTTAKSDGRVFFTVPRDGMLLVGTTDDRFEAGPGSVRPELREIRYLLDEACTLLPGLNLEERHVNYAYAGLRPLMRSSRGPEANITRRHQVVDHSRRRGPAGLYSIVGGKLSTSRPLSNEVAGLLGAGPTPETGALGPRSGHPRALAGRLRKYGVDVDVIVDQGDELLCKHSGLLDGEVVHAMRNELAETLSDALLRRTGAGWGSCRGLCNVEAMAAVAALTAGWGAGRTADEIEAFRGEVRKNLPTPEELSAES